ncbi:MAG: hypothetical protein H0U50_03030 [Pyrinomonadaceae bacterium]|nr:hypothetical protein [Pyrinomonadaceae bacterium]
MAKIQAIRKQENEINAPVSLGDRAFDNLQFIRETMERSAHFTAVPGYGGILMGATAIGAAYVANQQAYLRNWLIVWVIEAILAFFIGLLAMWQKSKIAKVSLVSAPARKFAMSFLPPLVCAIVITLGLWRFEHYEVMIPVWILLYGAAVVCGGAFSVKAVPIMGWCFIALGAIAFFVPAGFGNSLMALSFGVLHIVFGLIIARKFGG